MRSSEAIHDLAAALAAAQGEFTPVNKGKTGKIRWEKDGKSGEFAYKYADLADIMEMARPVLAKHGLSVFASSVIVSGSLVLVARLAHASGQWIEAEWPVGFDKDPKKMGSTLTFARRYTTSSLLGIVVDEDIDKDGAAEISIPERREVERRSAHRPDPEVLAAPLKKSIDALPDLDLLEKWPQLHGADLDTLPDAARNEVRMHYRARRMLLSGGVRLNGANGHHDAETGEVQQ